MTTLLPRIELESAPNPTAAVIWLHGLGADGNDFAENAGVTTLYIEDVYRLGIEGTIAEARRIAGGGPTYLTFDVDGIDPAYTPGTGTPIAVIAMRRLSAQLS